MEYATAIPATLRRYAMYAGFREVEILPIAHPLMRLYQLLPAWG